MLRRMPMMRAQRRCVVRRRCPPSSLSLSQKGRQICVHACGALDSLTCICQHIAGLHAHVRHLPSGMSGA